MYYYILIYKYNISIVFCVIKYLILILYFQLYVHGENCFFLFEKLKIFIPCCFRL